jgi:hypothetical protein
VVDSSPDLAGDEAAQIHPEMRLPPTVQVVNSNGAFRLNAFTITVAPVPARHHRAAFREPICCGMSKGITIC